MTVSMSTRSIDGSDIGDGPLLLTLIMGNNNNNAAAQALPDTLNPNNFALELTQTESDDEKVINGTPAGYDDEPLLFALMLGQNDNNTAAIANSPENGGFPDTLDPRGIGLEVKPVEIDMSKAIEPSVNGHDGPLLSMILLTNQNQNNQAAGDCQPLDTLNPKHLALELSPPANHSEETNRGHGPLSISLPLNKNHYKFEDTITEAIPVVFKWNSQVHQGRLVPVTGDAKSVMENSADQKFHKASIINTITSKPQSASSIPRLWVAPNEPQKGRLSDEQIQFWKDKGYLVIPNALPREQKDLLLKTVHDVAETLAGGGERVKKHFYLPGQKSYLHPSGRAIATLTEYAFKPNVEPLKRIQRLGCGIHRVIPAFRQAIFTPFHAALATSLGYQDPRIIQSLVIVKAAEVGARVIPHQDGCSGFTNPSSCTTFWYALEDCTAANGCLAVAPGSHRTQPITRRCRADQNGAPEFVDLDRPVFAEVDAASETGIPRENAHGELEYTKLEVEAGSLVLMHGNLMHTSEANHSRKSRVAFNFNVVEGRYAWLEDNYLQAYEGETEFEKLKVT
ncbi:hypothetical protein DSL72_008530 [Monilinia vaccinii-corymbosi]|uniref:Uncharacterized protein n=1 Tax=Monilinia vaccinii-corymbosi TaxID=61207 RepID=A0A8A3PRC0_9HELO|nr:hypothetical protein DSL72_008530 [Monilinia vaccinii-corymbosi]